METCQDPGKECFPSLKDHVRIKGLPDRNLVYDCRFEHTVAASATEAVLLALCTGTVERERLCAIDAEVFHRSREEAGGNIADFLQRFRNFLDLHDHPTPSRVRYDPLLFLRPIENAFRPRSYRDATPSELVLSLTYACNHRCDYCCNRSERRLPDELSEAEWLDVLDQGAALGVVKVTLSGGEPLTHPGFLEIVRRAHARGMYSSISTNGTYLTEDLIGGLEDAGASYIHLSLPAATEPLYDRIVGCRGHLPRVRLALRRLKDHGFHVRVKLVLTRVNASDVSSVLELCRDSSVDEVHLANFILTHNGRGDAGLLPTADQLQQIVALKEDYIRRYGHQPVILGPSTQPLKWSGPGDIVGCGGIKTKLTILPNGDVALCEALGSHPAFVLGNRSRPKRGIERTENECRCPGYRRFLDRGGITPINWCSGPALGRVHR